MDIKAQASLETEVIRAIAEIVRLGEAPGPEEALSHIAALIERLSTFDGAFDEELGVLLGLGATIMAPALRDSALARPRNSLA